MPLGAFKAALMGTAGVSTGDVVLLHDTDYSNTASASITSGITSTYGEYIFKFYNINAATSGAQFTFQCNATDSTSYDEAITSTFFRTKHFEDDSGTPVINYETGSDQAQGTGYQTIASSNYNAADASSAGELHLFAPSSTTYVKQWMAHFSASSYDASEIPYNQELHSAGYINTTTAIDDIQFKMSSGNFDGTIKMWGVK